MTEAAKKAKADYQASESSTFSKQLKAKDVAVLNVANSLIHKPLYFASGETSYSSLATEFTKFAEAGIKQVVMNLDSGGGEVSGLFEAVSELKAIKEQYGIALIGVTDSICASACYALATVCDTLYATEGAVIGSIGAIMMAGEQTKLDKKQGISYTILRSQPNKAKGNPHEKLDAATVERWQASLTKIDARFKLLVTESRDVSVATIDSLEGVTVTGTEAKKLGLIDEVLPYIDLKFLSFTNDNSPIQRKDSSMNETPITAEEHKAIVTKLEAEVVASAETLKTSKAEQFTLGITHATDVINLATTSGLTLDQAIVLATSGQSFEAIKTTVALAAKMSANNAPIHQEDIVASIDDSTTALLTDAKG